MYYLDFKRKKMRVIMCMSYGLKNNNKLPLVIRLEVAAVIKMLEYRINNIRYISNKSNINVHKMAVFIRL